MHGLRILIHLTGGTEWVGGVQYTRNLLRALSRLPSNECPPVVVDVGDPQANAALADEFGRLPNVTLDRPCPAGTWRGRVGEWFGPQHRLADDCTVAFPWQTLAPPAPRTPVYWVPDFQEKHLPQYFPEAERQSRERARREVFRQARFLVLSSRAVRADFERFYPEYQGVQVRVLPFYTVLDDEELGEDPSVACARLGLPERFAYVPNQFWQHKGHDTVFAALALLRSRGLKLPVVCTGNPDDYRNRDYFQSLQRFLAENGLDDQVTMLGLIPRREQIQVFRRASLVVQASRFEGWSTVVEDARSLGRPIVLSDLDVHLEQAPPGGTFFRVGDAEHLADVLASVWPACDPGPTTPDARVIRAGHERAVAFARNFLSIAAEAHALAPGRATFSMTSLRRGAAYFLKARMPRLARVMRALVARRNAHS